MFSFHFHLFFNAATESEKEEQKVIKHCNQIFILIV